MLIIFGTRGTSCSQKSTNEPCPCCGKNHLLTAVPYQNYLHVFWIPVFPAGRAFTLWCSNCEREFELDEIESSKEMKRIARPPLWTYIGTVLIAILLLFVFKSIFSDLKTDKGELAQKIENPQIGDIYELDFGDNNYSVMKVVSVTTDSAYFVFHKEDVNDKLNISQLVSGDSGQYKEDVCGYSKTELRADVLTGSVLGIRR